jgi:hypothetical protein
MTALSSYCSKVIRVSDRDPNDSGVAIELTRETLESKFRRIRQGFARYLSSAAGKDSDGSARQPGPGEIDKVRQRGERASGDCFHGPQYGRVECFDPRRVDVGRRRGRAGDRPEEGALSLIAFDAMNFDALNFR